MVFFGGGEPRRTTPTQPGLHISQAGSYFTCLLLISTGLDGYIGQHLTMSLPIVMCPAKPEINDVNIVRIAVGWGRDQINQPQGFGHEEKGVKQQIANLIHAVRTVMRGIEIRKFSPPVCSLCLHLQIETEAKEQGGGQVDQMSLEIRLIPKVISWAEHYMNIHPQLDLHLSCTFTF